MLGGSGDSLWEFVTPSTVCYLWIEFSLSWLAHSLAKSSQGSQECILLYFQEDLKTWRLSQWQLWKIQSIKTLLMQSHLLCTSTAVSPQCTRLNPKLTTTWALCVGSCPAEKKPKQHDFAAHGPSRGLLLGWEQTSFYRGSLIKGTWQWFQKQAQQKTFSIISLPIFSRSYFWRKSFPSILFINLDWRKAHISFIVGITDSY